MRRVACSCALALTVLSSALIARSEPVLADEPKAAAGPVETAQANIAPDPEPWRIDATLYGWLIGMSGNVTTHGQTFDTNASFIDLVGHSDSLTGFMGYFEADKGKVGFYTDLVYADLGFSAAQLNWRNPLPGLKITLATSEALTFKMFIVDLGGVYEVQRWSGSEGSFTALDLTGGIRYWNMSADASLDAALNVDLSHTFDFTRLGIDRTFSFERNFGLSVARSDSIQWVDPVIGLRLRHQFTPHQRVLVWGDVGGFGLQSSITWQGLAAYSYAWDLDGGSQVAALIGFRALGVNYAVPGAVNGFAMNETLYGPVIGVSFRW